MTHMLPHSLMQAANRDMRPRSSMLDAFNAVDHNVGQVYSPTAAAAPNVVSV
jgi:hypothetical protein